MKKYFIIVLESFRNVLQEYAMKKGNSIGNFKINFQMTWNMLSRSNLKSNFFPHSQSKLYNFHFWCFFLETCVLFELPAWKDLKPTLYRVGLGIMSTADNMNTLYISITVGTSNANCCKKMHLRDISICCEVWSKFMYFGYLSY